MDTHLSPEYQEPPRGFKSIKSRAREGLFTNGLFVTVWSHHKVTKPWDHWTESPSVQSIFRKGYQPLPLRHCKVGRKVFDGKGFESSSGEKLNQWSWSWIKSKILMDNKKWCGIYDCNFSWMQVSRRQRLTPTAKQITLFAVVYITCCGLHMKVIYFKPTC